MADTKETSKNNEREAKSYNKNPVTIFIKAKTDGLLGDIYAACVDVYYNGTLVSHNVGATSNLPENEWVLKNELPKNQGLPVVAETSEQLEDWFVDKIKSAIEENTIQDGEYEIKPTVWSHMPGYTEVNAVNNACRRDPALIWDLPPIQDVGTLLTEHGHKYDSVDQYNKKFSIAPKDDGQFQSGNIEYDCSAIAVAVHH